MTAGTALPGAATAPRPSWLLDRVQEVEEDEAQATHGDVKALLEEVSALRDELAAALARTGSAPGDHGRR